MSKLRRRCAIALVAVTAATSVLSVTSPAAAAVAAPEPVAIGQSEDGDLRVLAADTTTAGTKVKVRNYVAGQPADVKAQRWSFEVITPGAKPVYRIRHVASNRCLQSSAAAEDAAVVLADCTTANPQLWTNGTAQTFPTRGFDLRSKRDGRCLDLVNSGDNQPVSMWTCDPYYTTQLWQIRGGGFDCDWRIMVGLCASMAQPMFGVMTAFRQQRMNFTGPPSDPENGSGYNTLYNQINWNPLDSSGGDPGYDYAEMGWRGSYSADTGTTSHEAYWLEQSINGEEFHAILAPDSQLADGSMHTWMSLGNAAGQWDMFYDYNHVGTTRSTAGSRTRYLEYGLLAQYEDYASLATPFENRVQLIDGNNLWRRPRLGEVAAFAANICGQPDPYALELGLRNTPPYCFTTSLVSRTSTTPNSPAEVDRHVVGKPAVGSLAAGRNPSPAPAAPGGKGVHNGVDQEKLAACLAADADLCLSAVPGLAACVQARLICNVTTRKPSAAGTSMPAAKADKRARADVRDTRGAADTATITAGQFTKRSGVNLAGVGADAAVHVVTSSDTATSLSSKKAKRFKGYTMVYLASSGRLLYGCLGDDCSRKEFS